jgi:hypothetical protein
MGHTGMKYSPAQPRAHRRLRRDDGQSPLLRRHDLHPQLRQDRARHADGRHALQHPHHLRQRRADGAGPATAHDGPRPIDLISVFEGVGAYKAGQDRRGATQALRITACPTCGSCSGMFTANSMNCLCEALGMALPGNGTILAVDPSAEELWRAARRILELRRVRTSSRATSSPARPRQRLRARHGHGRLDQHRPPHPGHRPRGRHRLRPGAHQRAVSRAPNICKVSPLQPLPHRGRRPRRRRLRHPQGGLQGRAAALDAKTVTGRRWARTSPTPSATPGASARSRTPIPDRRAGASCSATWRPRARWSRPPASPPR